MDHCSHPAAGWRVDSEYLSDGCIRLHPLTLKSYFIAQVVRALDVPTKHLGHFMKLFIGGAEKGHHGLGLQPHH